MTVWQYTNCSQLCISIAACCWMKGYSDYMDATAASRFHTNCVQSCVLNTNRCSECARNQQNSHWDHKLHYQASNKLQPFPLFNNSIHINTWTSTHCLACKWAVLSILKGTRRNLHCLVDSGTGTVMVKQSKLSLSESWCCIIGNWTCFSFLKMFHLSPKRLLHF